MNIIEEKWPQVLYGYVILLDNKIENWKVSFQKKQSVYDFNGYWKKDRINDYKLEMIYWICRNNEEVNRAFEELAPRWFKSWKHASDYRLIKAYGISEKQLESGNKYNIIDSFIKKI